MRRAVRSREGSEGSVRKREQDEKWKKAKQHWENLIIAAQHRETYGADASQDLDALVPTSLSQDSNIEAIMNVATELKDESPLISRILSGHAYNLAQNLDPNSEGRGVLQFKTGLMSVLRQKSINKDDELTSQVQDREKIGGFYKYYRGELQKKELEYQQKWMMKSGWSKDPEAMELEASLKKGYKVLSVLREVLEDLPSESGYDDTEVMQIMEIDAVKIEEFGAYNILPLDAPGISHVILMKPEVKAAMAAVKYTNMSPMPEDFRLQYRRHIDIFDVLEYIFHFQMDNTKNQREHLVLLLANAQSRESSSDQSLQLGQGALDIVLKKVLSNYESWCQYLQETFKHKEATNKEKLILIALYLLIWGEASNVRFLPEGLCYIFHQMATEVLTIVRNVSAPVHKTMNYRKEDGSFLSEVIQPLYNSIAQEVKKGDHGKKPHSAWRNYDDFNEFFWSRSCFDLKWPMNMEADFFAKESKNEAGEKEKKKKRSMGKTNFVEHRSFLHLYHSFHRLWIFFVLMFQGLIIIAFSNGWNWETVERLLSIGPTYAVMKFIQSVLDVILMYGAYRRSKTSALSRIFIHLLWFGGLSGFLTYLYIQILQEAAAVNSRFFRLYVLVVAVYIGFRIFSYLLMLIPAYRVLSKRFDNWKVLRFFKWIAQEQFYVGRDLYENIQDYLKYILFWIVVLSCKFTFSYFFMIQPLVPATRIIVSYPNIDYKWHDIVSKNNGNALTVAALWSPIAMVYFLDVSVWYTVISAIVGGFIGARQRLGEIRSLEMLRKRFQMYPGAFVKLLPTRMISENSENSAKQDEELKARKNAARFAPYWNQIIECLREEDYISNLEKELLCMPPNNLNLPIVQCPLFLLTTKIEAMELLAAKQFRDLDLRIKMEKDEYMSLAFKEVYHTLDQLFNDILASDECKIWVTDLIKDVKDAFEQGTLYLSFRMSKIKIVRQKISVLIADFKNDETETGLSEAKESMQILYDTVMKEFCTPQLRERNEERIRRSGASRKQKNFSGMKWPSIFKKDQMERLYKLLKNQESAANIPHNLEARRRLQFFCNSLFMDMPTAPLAKEMVSFCVFTPYYEEDVFYDKHSLLEPNEDGISTLFYLQKVFPDEWNYLLERIGKENEREYYEKELTPGSDYVPLELLVWASYRGQTLARTVRGMMYYRRAIVLQSMLEQADLRDAMENQEVTNEKESEALAHAEAQADLKFTYVVTCQIYGTQKRKKNIRAEHILSLMKENNGLRVAFVDSVETLEDKTEYYSKVVKADETGKDQEIYSIKLPGNPVLGEGKPENQNHAIIFTRGEAIQTIDMNQDNYFEETLKMRNLLEEFNSKKHGCHDPRILGVREHVFTGSVSSLGWFMSTQETSFVTLGQRVLASPLKIRMHYGHPDVFDRCFHLTRGGISKSSKVINISEDIFAGFNSTLRQGNVTHHEYIQVGKGRDVGLNQIATFEGKVAGGNGEQSLSRDVYRLGQLLDFFRMLSFYITSVGYYLCTMMTALTVYVFLYGKAYLALSGVEEALQTSADITDNAALNAALNTQLLIQIGVFTAVPMIVGFILEEGVLKAIISFATMQLQLSSVFFTFSLGTRTHYFGRSILHGGAKYKATGRGFVVSHIKFAANYRSFSRSHCVKAFEIAMLLLVYHAYGPNRSTGIGYILLNFSSWFLAISWLFAPFIFNPSGFEWQKTVNDFDDWTNWLLYKGSVGMKPEDCWESWWEDEQAHIRFLRGKILETILSLRFFWFQYGIVYRLDAAGGSKSLVVYGVSWLVLIGIVVILKVYTLSSKKAFRILRNYSRLLQCFLFISIIGAVISVIIWTRLTVSDVFASALALIPTGWGILSIAITWKSVVKKLGLWKSIRSIARLYDAAMGVIIFLPIACLSWFPFVSTFQTRLVFNQAFSRGLEISLIVSGKQHTFKNPKEKKGKK